jgi:hypothetical protein
MVSMGRVFRSLATVLAVVAIAATLPAPCPCPANAAAPRGGHECCAPPIGVSSDDHGCCDEHADAADLLVPGPAAAPLPVDATVVLQDPLAPLEAAPRRPVVLAPSPPPAILRL